jgi:hypothetical protein
MTRISNETKGVAGSKAYASGLVIHFPRDLEKEFPDMHISYASSSSLRADRVLFAATHPQRPSILS